ncbi:MAG: class I SAM-dependent methyltransferase [Mariniblastus sp.]|nr:class I SAM-dependent methyltransferase [Mariniblastus sp.]
MPDNGCPLCQAAGAILFFEDDWRPYFRCRTCHLVFVPSEFHLSLEAEKAEYDLHQNSPDQIGYRRFLARLHDPVASRLAENSYGLDFGCGPGPTLSVMFREAGHRMEIYDPFYFDDPKKLVHDETGSPGNQPPYDFITASEVVEHLRDPAQELNRLWACLKRKGILGIMTKQVLDQASFASWHYKNDRTHICFFSRPTFQWLALQWSTRVEFIGSDVVLLERP